MTAGITVNLVTPEKLYLSTEANIMVAPGLMGDFGALQGHAPFVTLLRPGVITITKLDGTNKKIFVLSGFVEINQTKCTILAEALYDLDTTDVKAIESEISALKLSDEPSQLEKISGLELLLSNIKMH